MNKRQHWAHAMIDESTFLKATPFLNYPSITVPNLSGSVTVTRKLKNVGSPAAYRAQIVEPQGISVSIEPNILKFDKIGEEKRYKLTLKAKKVGFPRDYYLEN
ncbi:unnamed protein product [Camellia sinensis]